MIMLKNYILAAYPAILIQTQEEERAVIEVVETAKSLAAEGWSVSEWCAGPDKDGKIEPFPAFGKRYLDPASSNPIPPKTILLVRDAHIYLKERDPGLTRMFKRMFREACRTNRPLIFIAPDVALSPEIEKDITVLPFALPDQEQLGAVYDRIVKSATDGKEEQTTLILALVQSREPNIKSASGMTTQEAENAYAKAFIESGRKLIAPESVALEKANAIRKTGILELVTVPDTLDSIGGYASYKAWVSKRTGCFTQEAREYGLPESKGVLLLGVQGCGKSLASKATAAAFRTPLLRADMGKVFAGLVGSSEANVRSLIATAEACAPCVLWVDEVEKGMAAGSGANDGGTSQRVLGSMLTWMAEKTSPVFVIMTANDISALPPELMRKGRVDEIFFVDLPTPEERRAIFEIHLSKRGAGLGLGPDDFRLRELTKLSEGFSGAEIEQSIIDAMFTAFSDGRAFTTEDISTALKDTMPLSKTMEEKITKLREWAKPRTRPAGSVSKSSGPVAARGLN